MLVFVTVLILAGVGGLIGGAMARR